MLRQAFTQQLVSASRIAAVAPALRQAAALHSSGTTQVPHTSFPAQAEPSPLRGLLGLTNAELEQVLAKEPSLASLKPSELRERMQELGMSGTRLRSRILENPALLSAAGVRQMRSMAHNK